MNGSTLRLFAGALAAMAAAGPSLAQNLVNASFETGSPYGASCAAPNPLAQCGTPTPWICSTTSITCDLFDNCPSGSGCCGFGLGGITTYGGMFSGMIACDGHRFIGFAACRNGACNEAFQQTLTSPLVVGQCYTIGACMAVDDRNFAPGFGGPYAGHGEVWVYAGTTVVGKFLRNTQSLTWQQRSISFTATTAATVLKFEAHTDPTNNAASYMGLDDIRISRCCTPPPANMVLWLPFDEAGGGNGSLTANLMASGFPGTLAGPGAAFLGNTGEVARAVCFDQGRVDVPNYPWLFLDGNITMDAWIKPGPIGTPGWKATIIDKREFIITPTLWRGYWLYLDHSGATATLKLQLNDGIGAANVATGPVLATNQTWQHIAVTVKRNCSFNPGFICVDFYLNGVQFGIASFYNGETATMGTHNGLRIADDVDLNTNDGWFFACIDEVEVFSRDLTAAEVRKIYDAGSAGKCKQYCYRCRADFNCDDSVDFFDYLDFVQPYSEGDDRANFNLDGQVDFFDYLDFVSAYNEGC